MACLKITFLAILGFDLSLCLDLSHLLEKYTSACGSMLCNSTQFTGLRNENICPPCSCEDSCIWKRNCCPDKFFEWNFSCVNTDIIGSNFQHHAKTMVTKCHENVDKETKTKCESISSNFEGKLTNVPVTSSYTGITYRNLYCAKCYQEKDEHIQSWTIDTECLVFTDFNFLSTYEAIESQAISSKCTFSYMSPVNPFPFDKCWNDDCKGKQSCDIGPSIIAECNVTGTWEHYDEDVELACNTYDNLYDYKFKNVFCYICNPPRNIGKVIDTCNVTGWWERYNTDEEGACMIKGETTLTFPFKNYYCYLCNMNEKSMNNQFTLKAQELDAFVLYKLTNQNDEWKFENFIEHTHLYTDKIIQNVFKSGENKSFAHYSTNQDFRGANLSNVLEKYYAYTGLAIFSSNYSYFPSLDNCESSDDCFFTDSCCIDKYFERSAMCSDPLFSEGGRGYPVFDSCTEPSLFSNLCLINSSENFLDFMPVVLDVNKHKSVYMHYRNIYCALCDTEKHSINHDNLRLWRLKVSCKVFIPHYYFISVNNYFAFLKANKCTFEYKPFDQSNYECSNRNKKCNVTKHWTINDPDIEFACEKNVHPSLRMYAFCEMCNPEEALDMEYHFCNQSGNWTDYDDYIDNNCETLPEIQAMAPYKNYFCKQCNRGNQSDNQLIIDIVTIVPPSPQDPTHDFGVTYRSVFAFSNYSPRRQQTILQCQSNQTLYKNRCLDIVCYPGKMLVNTGCQPLLQTTSKLGYILFASMKVIPDDVILNTELFHYAIDKEFKAHIVKKMNLPPWIEPFDSTYLNSGKNCKEVVENGEVISVDVFYVLFFEDYVNRTLVEETLVHFITTSFNFSHENVTSFVEVIPNHLAINTPNKIANAKFTNNCHIKNQMTNAFLFSKVKKDFFVYSYVSELLLCEQVKLSSNEFEIDKNTMELNVKGSDLKLPFNKYIMVAQGKAQVCIEYLTSGRQPTLNHGVNVWSILTLGCIILSIVCLFVTFVTYCFFSSLRTLPGKNNMCLVFALFCSNVIFLIITQGINSEIGCKAVGILMHYFWLATFSCLGVCSFHMYRVFTSKTGTRLSERSNLIIYVWFSYGFPAISIILNIIITLSVTTHTIGYGGSTCFLTEPMAFIFTFIVPVGLICCSNVFFFICTSVTIARSPKLTNDSNMKTNQVQFVVYVKLFAITGITWLLQIVDAFVPESPFSVVVAILNALQGFFIFLSYICNKRVLNLYRGSQGVRQTSSLSRNMTSLRSQTTELSESDYKA